MPDTPPFNPMEFLPRSFTLSVMSTVFGLRIALDVGGVFLLQHFEIAELVEPQNAVGPTARIEDVAFVQQDLAADDFVARGGVAREIDAPDEELLAFVGRQRQVDLVAVVVEAESPARERNR
jgi:hypothetical protein